MDTYNEQKKNQVTLISSLVILPQTGFLLQEKDATPNIMNNSKKRDCEFYFWNWTFFTRMDKNMASLFILPIDLRRWV